MKRISKYLQQLKHTLESSLISSSIMGLLVSLLGKYKEICIHKSSVQSKLLTRIMIQ